jgi:polysaccharide deacetylase 2 family uncharacterized protein YibQ
MLMWKQKLSRFFFISGLIFLLSAVTLYFVRGPQIAQNLVDSGQLIALKIKNSELILGKLEPVEEKTEASESTPDSLSPDQPPSATPDTSTQIETPPTEGAPATPPASQEEAPPSEPSIASDSPAPVGTETAQAQVEPPAIAGKSEVVTIANPVAAPEKNRIVIIVHGLGLSQSSTTQAMELPKEVTLGFSPYSNNLPDLIEKSINTGHDTILHLPLQPEDYLINDPGPSALLSNLSTRENLDRLELMLNKASKILGVYTSPNEIFSSNPQNEIAIYMKELKHRKLSLVLGSADKDKRLIEIAHSIDLKMDNIDLLVDDQLTKESIERNFIILQNIAQSKGYAIGALRSYPVSITALKNWINDINFSKFQEIEIIPLSKLMS